EKEYTPNRKLSISSASSSRSSGSTSHKKLKSNNGTSHIPSPEPYILENGTNSTTEAEHDNNNHSPHGVQAESDVSTVNAFYQTPPQLMARNGNEKIEPMVNPTTKKNDISVPASSLSTPATCGPAIIAKDPM
ncbi:4494_t:CDS:2, partial [Racocetra fulgida]